MCGSRQSPNGLYRPTQLTGDAVALNRTRARGTPDARVRRVRPASADVARLSPYMRRHINFHGHYSFAPTELGGARRALHDPDAPEDG
jgi:hypothetical protein